MIILTFHVWTIWCFQNHPANVDTVLLQVDGFMNIQDKSAASDKCAPLQETLQGEKCTTGVHWYDQNFDI